MNEIQPSLQSSGPYEPLKEPFKNMNKKWLNFLADLARTFTFYSKMIHSLLSPLDIENVRCDVFGKAIKMGQEYPDIADAMQEAMFHLETFGEDVHLFIKSILGAYENLDNIIKTYIDSEIDLLPAPLLSENFSFYEMHSQAKILKRWMVEAEKYRSKMSVLKSKLKSIDKNTFNILSFSQEGNQEKNNGK